MDEISGLIIKMTEFFSGDPKRIQHFIKVHTFARVIGRAEGLDIRAMHCLDVASVVHDIGIKPAEERYGKGHCGGTGCAFLSHIITPMRAPRGLTGRYSWKQISL